MLPFLSKRKDQTSPGIVVKTRTPDEKPDQDDKDAGHLACARDLMAAIKAGNEQGVADALYDAFTLMDSEPHEEGEHTNPEPHSYDAQNQAAGEE